MALAGAAAADEAPPRVAATESLPPVGLRRSSRFIPELESVRGLAVLLVFTFHLDALVRFPFGAITTTSLGLAFVHSGHTGVDLFFVLSAFLLSLPFLEEASGGKPISIPSFFKRRALRILPLYWAAVAVTTMLTSERLADLGRGFPYLVFLNSFPRLCTPIVPHNGVWWSLATEVQFYLLLPLLALVIRWRWGRAAGLTFLATHAYVYIAFVREEIRASTAEGQTVLLLSIVARGPLFLWGLLAAAIYHRFGNRLRERLAGTGWLRNGGADVLMLAVLVTHAFLLRWVVAIGPVRRMSAGDQPWHVANGALWAAFILLVLLAPLRTKSLFSNPVLARFGILSYSIYLLHAPFLRQGLFALRATWPRTFDTSSWTPATSVAAVLLSAACFGLSALTYRFIEQPFLVRKGRMES